MNLGDTAKEESEETAKKKAADRRRAPHRMGYRARKS